MRLNDYSRNRYTDHEMNFIDFKTRIGRKAMLVRRSIALQWE